MIYSRNFHPELFKKKLSEFGKQIWIHSGWVVSPNDASLLSHASFVRSIPIDKKLA